MNNSSPQHIAINGSPSRSIFHWLFCFLLLSLSHLALNAQQTDESDSISDPLAEYELQIPSLISYLSLNLNALGDPDLQSRDKDIIITQSYTKFFDGAHVQIEDDLDTARKVVTYKEVQAYLKDVEFFFKEVQFEFQINKIDRGSRVDGQPFFTVDALRQLSGIGIRGDTIENNARRFIEINLDELNGELRIASIYTTKIHLKEERRLWWSTLNAEWKNLLASNMQLPLPPLANEGTSFENIRFFNDALLITTTDTFLFDGWRKSSLLLSDTAMLTGSDTLSVAGLDSLQISVGLADNFLDSLLNRTALIISDTIVSTAIELAPLRRLNSLAELHLQGLQSPDFSALRNLIHLKVLSLRNCAFNDVDLLRYATELEQLDLSGTKVSSLQGITNLRSLKSLHLAGTHIDSLQMLAGFKKLEELNLSHLQLPASPANIRLTSLKTLIIQGTPVVNLAFLNGFQNLSKLNIDNTGVRDLSPLGDLKQLEEVSLNGCAVSDLAALGAIPALRKIYCDHSKVQDKHAQAFMRDHPEVLVIYGTLRLRNWWNILDDDWRRKLMLAAGLDTSLIKIPSADSTLSRESLEQTPNESLSSLSQPSREDLHAISELRSLHIDRDTLLGDLNALIQLANLNALSLTNCGITDISALSVLRELQTLNVSGNPITSIDTLWHCDKLETLDIRKTLVASLPSRKKLRSIRLVYADDCPLAENQAERFIKNHSEVLLVHRTPILTKWWMQTDSVWQSVLLKNARIASPGHPNAVELERIASLKELLVPKSEIEDLKPISQLADLRILDISDNQISNLWPLNRLRKLQVFRCSNNPVDNLDVFEDMPSLIELVAENTGIGSLAPVSGHTAMKRLNCAGTNVRNLNALTLMADLEELNCSNTKVKSLKPLTEAWKLQKLIAFNSGISEIKIEKFQLAHPECEIVFY